MTGLLSEARKLGNTICSPLCGLCGFEIMDLELRGSDLFKAIGLQQPFSPPRGEIL